MKSDAIGGVAQTERISVNVVNLRYTPSTRYIEVDHLIFLTLCLLYFQSRMVEIS
jgi:hypothetical protein